MFPLLFFLLGAFRECLSCVSTPLSVHLEHVLAQCMHHRIKFWLFYVLGLTLISLFHLFKFSLSLSMTVWWETSILFMLLSIVFAFCFPAVPLSHDALSSSGNNSSSFCRSFLASSNRCDVYDPKDGCLSQIGSSWTSAQLFCFLVWKLPSRLFKLRFSGTYFLDRINFYTLLPCAPEFWCHQFWPAAGLHVGRLRI